MSDSWLKIKEGKINFQCKLNYCSNSCCGPFAGINENIVNIDNRPFSEIVLSEADINRLYDNGYSQFIETSLSKQTNKEYKKMALYPDGSCKAFIDGKCSINEIKPTLCRAFPFYFDMFSGLCAITCEGFSDKYWSDLGDYEECFEAARKMYEFWIDFYTPKKEI